ncbi:WD repeat-containing protein 24 [Cryptotermes secundus]|uniref:GATOR2 complex protein WDR24 n=1 Tax=Cryptotermes secundus TaxID=105785 RepID=A0A2J7R1B0_9NEOP|nr:GATOR complex protein WDR24 [Cryptotermes secundus]PNF34616.1 WD repeat-containing protein 24 [Cryptotermes secundus]
MSRTTCITQDGPANALALNKDYSQVVIAGRNVFKVFSIEEDEFVENCNLRVGKNLNLNFSCNDVAWNTIEDHLLATAATNGAVVLWNLNRLSRSKQEHVFMDHKRTVNKVSFHTSEPTWLISGSQDGTMKCFDLRTREATRTFYSNTESVRDVQFSPQLHHVFAAVSENGNVQLWDLRRPDRCYHQFTAHSGPVFACDWHPEVAWLATASRDKTIKVWDLAGKPSLEYTIHTIASVGHIKWRPQRKYHIASCALVVDCSINVWDVRRPYIPFAAFNEHKDVATGVAWRGDPHVFLSTSRDCTLYQHVFQDASRPASKANPQAISLNSKGDMMYACRVNMNPVRGPAKLSSILRKAPLHSEQFCQASSVMHRFLCKTPRETQCFHECARRYILTGRPLTDICDHNAAVAKDLNRHHVSLVWSVVKTLYSSKVGDFGQQIPSGNVSREETGLGVLQTTLGTSTGLEPIITGAGGDGDQRSLLGGGGETPRGAMSAGEDETETDETPEQHINGRMGLGNLPIPQGDFFFGDGEMDPLSVDFDRMNNGMMGMSLSNGLLGGSHMLLDAQTQQDWTLPSEAFPLRHEIQDRSPPPEQFPNHGSPDLNDHDSQPVTTEDQPSSLLSVTAIPRLGLWDPSHIMVEMLKHHASLGDVQTSTSVLLALGDRRRSLTMLDEATQEHWLLGYLDTLARYQLWEVGTQVIQLAWIPSVMQLNQQSTTVHTSCGQCSKLLQRTGWLCDRCHSSECALCSVCHQVVRGLYAWCQGCSHGGHLAHLQEWWEVNKQCPTGCGHICEYS